ncbi:MAG TPA: extracellular solute-binding protein [Candidatus Limnocylindrales bacterium]
MLDTPSRRAFLIGVLSCGAMTAAVTYFLPGGKPAPPARLRLITGADSTGGRQLLFDMWNAANPDTQVDVIIAQGTTEDQKRQMLDAAGRGTADLVNLDIIHIQEFAAQRLISRIELGKDRFLTPTIEAGQIFGDPGRYWAAPFNTDVGMLFERVPAGGAPAKDPSLSSVIDGLSPDSQGFVGQVGPGSSASNEPFVVNVLEHALSRDKDIFDANDLPEYDLGRWQRALAPLRNAIVTRRARPVDNESTSLTAFMASPPPPYMRGWPVQYRELQERNDPDVIAGRIRVHPLPIGVLGGQSLAVVANSRYQARAKRLIDFLTGDEGQKVVAAHGLAPTRVAAYSDPKLRAFIPHLDVIRRAVENAQPRPVHRNYAAFARAVVKHVRPLLADGVELPSMFIDEIRSALSGPPA